LNEGPEVHSTANENGFRYFTDVSKFKAYVRREILAEVEEVA
jgi:hypothetical protein